LNTSDSQTPEQGKIQSKNTTNFNMCMAARFQPKKETVAIAVAL
jgi:hypothetical protein